MQCGLVELTEGPCVDPYGGIHTTLMTQCSDIEDVTFGATDEITAFMMVASPEDGWVKYIYEDDDSGYYNQTGTRNHNRHDNDGEAFMKFEGLSIEKVNFANKIQGCCCLVAVHFTNNGVALCQGIEWDPSKGVDGGWRFNVTKCKATVNIMTGTGDENNRVEITLTNKGKKASPVVDMTVEDLEAL